MSAIFIIAALLGVLWVLRSAGRMSPKQARAFGAKIMGWILLALAGILCLHGNFGLGLPAAGIGAGLLGYGNFFAPKPQARAGSSNQAPVTTGSMDRREAYDVLGLKSGASRDEITAAYKRLQRANHPDTGGSTYLAAKINQARDLLLNS